MTGLYCSQTFNTTAQFNYRLPSTLNSTSTLMVVLRQLHYSRASRKSPTLRLQCNSLHIQLQDCTLQQSVLLPTNTEHTTTPYSDVSFTGPKINSAAAWNWETISTTIEKGYSLSPSLSNTTMRSHYYGNYTFFFFKLILRYNRALNLPVTN
jgi:hypothetical protein